MLLPCYNEEVTIGKVVRDFKASLPQADIYVYDNNSTDRTADIAASEGAIVRKEPRQGKGNVIRAMFEDIDIMIMWVIFPVPSSVKPIFTPLPFVLIILKRPALKAYHVLFA